VSFDIHWTLTVQVPQLEQLIAVGVQLVESVQAIKDQVARLVDGQAQQTDALAAQIEAIVAEMQQFSAQDITQEQLDNLLTALTATADTAHQQAADIRSNTEQITGIVPDAAPPAP
jgi:ABC-type transporter Mla subunit MlaD